MDNVSITLLCTIAGGIFGYLSYSRHQKRDLAKDTKEETETISKAVSELQYVSRGVDDIKYDIKNLSSSLQNTNERVLKLEMGLEVANKRIDDLGGK